jgi:hypothetical protein
MSPTVSLISYLVGLKINQADLNYKIASAFTNGTEPYQQLKKTPTMYEQPQLAQKFITEILKCNEKLLKKVRSFG